MIIGDKEFKKRYQTLNSEQKQAVDNIYGPIMVIAGPGTGKTTILTLRIANIIRLTDTAPESILALTFTESGAEAMRKKLLDIIGSMAYRIKINTFHGFANELINEFPNYFSKIIGGRLLNEIEQISIIRTILDTQKMKKLTPKGDRFYYTKKIINAIKHLKLENISPNELLRFTKQELAIQKNIKKNVSISNKLENNQDLVVVFQEYERELKKRKLYDFEDILVETIRAFETNPDFLAEIRENIQFVMADEHQDANGAQNAILELLAGFDDTPNLFIVGDEKQAIYRFQGASLENFLYFKKRFKKSKIINLIKNYRSGQMLLDASHSLSLHLEKSEDIARPKLESQNKNLNKVPAIKIYSFPSEETEIDYVLNEGQKLLKAGKSIAILTRKNKDLEDINQYAKRLKIPIQLNAGLEIFQDNNVVNFLEILRAVNDLTDNENLFKALFANFLNIKVIDLFKISREIKSRKIEKKYLIDLIGQKKFLESIGLSDIKHLLVVKNNLIKWSQIAKTESLTDTIDLIAKESGFINKIFVSKKIEDSIAIYESLHKFSRNVSENKKNAKISDLISSLDLMELHNMKIMSKIQSITDNRIQVMTIHKSKGLEFDYVFLYKLDDSRLGKNTERNSFLLPSQVSGHLIKNDENDEKRLLYVALTRARDEVCITFPILSDDGKSLVKSRFIDEIDQKFLIVKDKKNYKPKLLTGLLNSKIKNNIGQIPDNLRSYAINLFLENGLNATALNNYLKCPWRYFFQNLIRIPKNMVEHQIYGSAIHDAIHKSLLEVMKNHKKINTKKAIGYFKNYLSQSIIDSKTEKRLLARGKKVLAEFLPTLDYLKKGEFKTEYKITGIPLYDSQTIITRLGGKLDLIEKVVGGYKVVDFKTGSVKSRNDILGNTKSSSGDIYRQLVFYKILIEDQSQSLGQMVAGEIKFVEPNKNQILKTETFSITNQEKNDLLEILKKTADEILNFKFWQRTCEDKKCEFCDMAKEMKNNL